MRRMLIVAAMFLSGFVISSPAEEFFARQIFDGYRLRIDSKPEKGSGKHGFVNHDFVLEKNGSERKVGNFMVSIVPGLKPPLELVIYGVHENVPWVSVLCTIGGSIQVNMINVNASENAFSSEMLNGSVGRDSTEVVLRFEANDPAGAIYFAQKPSGQVETQIKRWRFDIDGGKPTWVLVEKP